MKIIRRDSLLKEEWSGGSTTEIMIFPPGTSYNSRDFLWRLSEATIEEENTTFTKLNGFYRITLVLEGQLTLKHEGFEPVCLNTLDQNHYKGHWLTVSEGKVMNLNLIYDSSFTATMETIRVHAIYYDYTLMSPITPRVKVQHIIYALAPLDFVGGISLKKGEAIAFSELADVTTLEFYSPANDIQFVYIRLEREMEC